MVLLSLLLLLLFFFFFNDTATTEIYTLSLHDALPIFFSLTVTIKIAFTGFHRGFPLVHKVIFRSFGIQTTMTENCKYLIYLLFFHKQVMIVWQKQYSFSYLLLDRKSTRLNSSHRCISYAVFCLKKKKIISSLNGTQFFKVPQTLYSLTK